MNRNSFGKQVRQIARSSGVSRRRFLQGVGACVALPAFESLMPRALGATTVASTGAAPAGAMATTATGAPLRMGFVYVPNGAIPAKWRPGSTGPLELSPTLQPLLPVKQQVQVFEGLDQVNATAGPDGAGDHARASGTFLTSVRVKKTAGSDIHAGVSIDQVIASHVGDKTRFPSLELTCDSIRKSGNCDSGYSCAYQYNLSWQSPTTPVAPESNPRLVFERLFGYGAPGERRANFKLRQQQQKSILDFVKDDAQTLDRQLGNRDQQKLDEYLTGVREIEKRIESAERHGQPADPNVPTPDGIPEAFKDHIGLMFGMMHLAFQTDSTRIATFLLAGEGSNRSFNEIGIPEGHHFLSHHHGDQDMIDKVAKIDLFYTEQFGAFLTKLDQTKDVDGKSILHNSMIVYGSGNSDGNQHTHVNLPIILAGAGGGTLQTGRCVNFEGTPMANLYLTMADRVGVQGLPRFGDSTGRISGI
jgi:hypothetical protein